MLVVEGCYRGRWKLVKVRLWVVLYCEVEGGNSSSGGYGGSCIVWWRKVRQPMNLFWRESIYLL